MPSKAEIQSIRALSNKSERDAQGLFVVEGTRSVLDIVQSSPDAIRAVYARNAWLESQNIHWPQSTTVQAVSAEELARISHFKTPNQVLALVTIPQGSKVSAVDRGRYVLLDNIQDPGNVGSIVRNADWFGLDGVLLGAQSADMFNPKVVQASMGSVMRVNYHRFADDQEMLNCLRESSSMVLAADTVGDVGFGVQHTFVLAIGQEGRGLNRTILDIADQRVSVRRLGKAESLNAAVACGVILSRLI